jgi:predicted DNA-binding transcriptional regulator AlpA
VPKTPVRTSAPLSKFILLNEVLELVPPLDGRTLRRYVRQNKFPPPSLRFSPSRWAWDRAQLMAWLDAQSAAAVKGGTDAALQPA